MEYWYSNPMQVKYLLSKDIYSKGIVFHKWLVDIYSGEYYNLDELYAYGRFLGYDDDEIIIEYCEWKDFLKII